MIESWPFHESDKVKESRYTHAYFSVKFSFHKSKMSKTRWFSFLWIYSKLMRSSLTYPKCYLSLYIWCEKLSLMFSISFKLSSNQTISICGIFGSIETSSVGKMLMLGQRLFNLHLLRFCKKAQGIFDTVQDTKIMRGLMDQTSWQPLKCNLNVVCIVCCIELKNENKENLENPWQWEDCNIRWWKLYLLILLIRGKVINLSSFSENWVIKS